MGGSRFQQLKPLKERWTATRMRARLARRVMRWSKRQPIDKFVEAEEYGKVRRILTRMFGR